MQYYNVELSPSFENVRNDKRSWQEWGLIIILNMNLKTNGGPLTKMCFLLQLQMKEFGLIIELVACRWDDSLCDFVCVCTLLDFEGKGLGVWIWSCEQSIYSNEEWFQVFFLLKFELDNPMKNTDILTASLCLFLQSVQSW